jgi:MYXO-CTERM domain-containing protein
MAPTKRLSHDRSYDLVKCDRGRAARRCAQKVHTATTPAPGRGSRRAALPLAWALAILFAFAFALAGVRPTAARADGDPASDVLLAQDVFYPYQPKVSPALEAGLEKTLRAAARADGLHLKVAIIGTAEELGLVPKLFGYPQAYAQFLDREISFNQPQSLLVVMPVGFGVMPASYADALAPVPIYKQQRSDGLTRSAILAVAALARRSGHPIPMPSITASSSSGSSPAPLVFGLPVALLLLAGIAVMRRRRPRSAELPAERDEN